MSESTIEFAEDIMSYKRMREVPENDEMYIEDEGLEMDISTLIN